MLTIAVSKPSKVQPSSTNNNGTKVTNMASSHHFLLWGCLRACPIPCITGPARGPTGAHRSQRRPDCHVHDCRHSLADVEDQVAALGAAAAGGPHGHGSASEQAEGEDGAEGGQIARPQRKAQA